MTTAEIVTVVVVAVLVVAFAGALATMTRRSAGRKLRRQFGPEYDRTLAKTGDPKQTNTQLRERINERDHLELRPLSRVDRDRFMQEWRQIQARFVDSPEGALANADGLLSRVMHDRGYPVDNFDQQADLVSVDHPQLVDNYRKAHRVRNATQEGRVETEEQRNAFLAYRSLFAELLDQPSSERSEPRAASS